MLKLQMSLVRPGCAQGRYLIRAKGCILAVLQWGSGTETLPGWGPFAYVPIDPAGNGAFFFPGSRAIPGTATHVWARCYSHDFSSCEDVSARIPEQYLPSDTFAGNAKHFSVLTDLHLSSKPWKVTQALKAAESDIIFLLGDSSNDGLPEQFERFGACIAAATPEKTLFPVIGNHDVPYDPQGTRADGCSGYAGFQHSLLAKAQANGYAVSPAPDGRAYSVQTDGLDIVALQCVTAGRVFRFPEERQIDWLEQHLAQTPASRHIILCHAPLLAHNPNRNAGQPYLHKNKRIQDILDRNGNILFLSGHTHVSPNLITRIGEYDKNTRNIYLDCGSVVPTDLSGETGLTGPDWKDGCITELYVSRNETEIRMRSIETGILFPRGYYRFDTECE